jgi:hypothetical protein
MPKYTSFSKTIILNSLKQLYNIISKIKVNVKYYKNFNTELQLFLFLYIKA